MYTDQYWLYCAAVGVASLLPAVAAITYHIGYMVGAG